jgi:conjugal transfer pilus assembly protein TraB
MSVLNTLAAKYKGLSSGARTALIGGVAVIVLFTVGTIFADGPGPNKKGKSEAQKDTLTVYNPGSRNATEGVAAGLDATNKTLQEQQAKILLLTEANKQAEKKGNTDGQWTDVAALVTQIQVLTERVNSLSASPVRQTGEAAPMSGKSTLESPLPVVGGSVATKVMTADAPPSTQPVIQVVGEAKPAAKADSKKSELSVYVPSGSNFEAVLLNGMDASTAIGANRTPTPALLRIKTEAILPNLQSYNLKECFVLVGGYGNMSSERVEMRTETMSCLDEAGAVWEGKIEGYLVGEDGKAGARGRVVSKQGALLAKTFMAGFVGGLGSAFTPQAVPVLDLAVGPTSSYQMPSKDQVVGSGISTGLNKSSQALASFYIKLAEQMFPIVELDAGRKMTIILLKGVDLKMEKKS